ncbi:MAG: HEPN domain-containing protein [Bacteroidales bacterium]|nr:HEPN domain-containing protein [Bacteroidales bacterium]
MNNEIVRKWLIKAENDFKTAKDELATENPATDTVCFHLQQCIEKYLKAFIIFHQKEIRRTHDIAELIEACIEIDPAFKMLYEYDADNLTVYAIEVRYPDEFYIPTIEETNNCLNITLLTKKFIIRKLEALGFVI